MIHSLWVPTKILLTEAWSKIRWHILLILFQHFVILSTFSLKPSSESPARASHKSSSQGPWSACSRSCGGGVQWRAQLNGTRYLFKIRLLNPSTWTFYQFLTNFREWRVCVSPACPGMSSLRSSSTSLSPGWADRLCAQHKQGYQYGQWLSFVR